ncbi:MAG: hypothetical protein ACTTKL_06300 [Treponema sp.]
MSAAALLFGCKLPTSGGDKNNQDNGGTITTPGGNSHSGSGGQSGGGSGGGGSGSGGHTGGGGSGGGSGQIGGGGSGGSSGGAGVLLQLGNTNWSGTNGDIRLDLFFAVTGNTVDIELSSASPNSTGSTKLTASYAIFGSKVSFNINTFDSWKNITTVDDLINVMKSAAQGRIIRFKAKMEKTTDAMLKAEFEVPVRLAEEELEFWNNLSEENKEKVKKDGVPFFKSLGSALAPHAHFEGTMNSAQTSMAVTNFPIWDSSGNVTPVSFTLTKR